MQELLLASTPLQETPSQQLYTSVVAQMPPNLVSRHVQGWKALGMPHPCTSWQHQGHYWGGINVLHWELEVVGGFRSKAGALHLLAEAGAGSRRRNLHISLALNSR